MTRINTLRIWKQITRPVGINGWCSTLFTLACVAIIRVQGDISPGHWAEAYFTALYFAKNLLALGFLYCFACSGLGIGRKEEPFGSRPRNRSRVIADAADVTIEPDVPPVSGDAEAVRSSAGWRI